MSQPAAQPAPNPVVYPESDGLPMADNTRQLRWIVVLYDNLAALFRDRPDVFVGANQFWYPVEGEPETRAASGLYLVFGRPKGDRGSYRQWEEGDVPLTVVFEVLCPEKPVSEMLDKESFYEQYGVEEYYIYDPVTPRLFVYLRQGDLLRRIRPVTEFVSPRLKVRFDMSGPELVVFRPDGHPFLTFEELEAARLAAEQRAARLAELSRKARQQRASREELAELERLEQPAPPAS